MYLQRRQGHLYYKFGKGGRARPPSRWKVKQRDEDLLRAAAAIAAWNSEASTTTRETGVKVESENLRQVMTAICDAIMPRTMLDTGRRRAVYWWTPDIAELRTRCAQAKKRYQRVHRRQRLDEGEVSLCYRAYRELRRSLQKEIKMVEAHAWSDLVEAVDSDP
jgi:hypothetical protein